MVNNALDFGGIARARDLTLINTVPSAIKVLVEEGQVPASVQVVNLAGEALPGALVQAIYRTTPVRAVYNLYGPSEDTTYSTGALIGRDEPREPVIGRPLSNGQVYVLDAQRQPVPIGVVGEIYVGGAGVARGRPRTPRQPDGDVRGPRRHGRRSTIKGKNIPRKQICYNGRPRTAE